jgi:ABC-type Fe3+-hydroxamate transport system substrate-binding protein
MEAAGLRNIAVELGIRDYGRMGLEELIRARPDMIIFSSEQKKGKTVRGEVLDHPAIKKALPAVKAVTLPTFYLNCGSPASVEAVRILVGETK